MRQRESDDHWQAVFVNVEAETAWQAIEQTVLDRGRVRYGDNAEGRWVAFPNEYFVAYTATITRIAEINLAGPEDMV